MYKLILIFLVLCNYCTAVLRDYAIIETKSGKVRGEIVYKTPSSPRQYVTQFLGVPYAAPPIGELRFRPPRPPINWNRIMDTIEHGNICPQDTNGWSKLLLPEVYKDRVQHNHTDEDCLTLDIYVPRNLKEGLQNPEVKLPVMVWFHGGDFQTQSAMLYGGHFLAIYGDVIVVGVNYRLGVLGFLSMEDNNIPGNFGLLDQLRALEWLKENIGAFGGDSERITIFGQEAGGVSVAHHVNSPLSRGYFSRAISQSGVAIVPEKMQKNSSDMSLALIEATNCTSNTSFEVATCLRNFPANKLIKISRGIAKRFSDNWYPVVDNDFITKHPLEILRDRVHTTVNYMIGINSHEGYAKYQTIETFFKDSFPSEVFSSTVANSLRSEYRTVIDKIARAAANEYETCAQNISQRQKEFVHFAGEYHYISPSYMTAMLHAKTGARTYFYEFNHRPCYKADDENIPDYVKANHGDEINYVFGNLQYLIGNSTEEDKKLSWRIMKAWSYFAKNGNPNPFGDQGVHYWKPLTEDSLSYVELNTAPENEMTRSNFRPVRMSFWNSYVLNMKLSMLEGDTCQALDPDTSERDGLRAELKSAKQSIVALIVVFLILLIIAICLLLIIILYPFWRKRQKRRRADPDREENHRPHDSSTSSDPFDQWRPDRPWWQQGPCGKCFTRRYKVREPDDGQPSENHRLRNSIEEEDNISDEKPRMTEIH